MKRYLIIILIVSLTNNIFCQNQNNSSTGNIQLIEWSKQCVKAFNKAFIPDTCFYEPVEWILIAKKAVFNVSQIKCDRNGNMTKIPETLRGCINLLDVRGEFEQYYEISDDPDAFLAVSHGFKLKNITTGNTDYFEKTFILDEEGTVLEFYDYISPKSLHKMRLFETLNAVKSTLPLAGKDTTNTKWYFDSNIQNWILQKDCKKVIQFTPIELVLFSQKYMDMPKNKSLVRLKDLHE